MTWLLIGLALYASVAFSLFAARLQSQLNRLIQEQERTNEALGRISGRLYESLGKLGSIEFHVSRLPSQNRDYEGDQP